MPPFIKRWLSVFTPSAAIDHIPARTAWAEARGQGPTAMQAVLCVIRNRAIDGGWWGDTYDSVCLHPYQFSCWNSNDPNLPKLKAVTSADPQFAQALALEAQLMAGTLDDITHGADSYYAVHSPEPAWAKLYKQVAVIGGQVFYQTRSLTAIAGRPVSPPPGNEPFTPSATWV